jgi:hypothetical protein
LGRGDARYIALNEQRVLQGTAFHQRLDRRGAQRGNPVQACRFDVLGDARLSDHAAITDQNHVVEVEGLFEFLDLRGERFRIAGMPSNTSIATGQPSGAHSRP